MAILPPATSTIQSARAYGRLAWLVLALLSLGLGLSLVLQWQVQHRSELADHQQARDLARVLLDSVGPEQAAILASRVGVRVIPLDDQGELPPGYPTTRELESARRAAPDLPPFLNRVREARESTMWMASRLSLGNRSWIIHSAHPQGEFSWTLTFSLAAGIAILVIMALVQQVLHRRLRQSIQAERQALNRLADEIRSGNFAARIPTPGIALGPSYHHRLNRALDHIGQAMDRLVGEKHQFAQVFHTLDEGLIITGSDERVRLANPAALALMESPGPVEGKTIIEAFRNIDLDEQFQAGRQNPGGVHQAEFSLFQGGREVLIHLTMVTLNNGRRHKERLVVLKDISTYRRLERLRTEFVANVSHELKTPITAILGFMETLLEGAQDDHKSRDHMLRIIDRQAHRMHSIITDLLMLSRVEQDGRHMPREPVDIDSISRSVVDTLVPRAAEKHIILTHRALPRAPIPYEANRSLLEQAVLNLASNAVAYSPEGSVVELVVEQAADGAVEIRVKDNGPGIPLRDQERIFERFYRVDKARSRKEGGTGLGLAIVRHIVLNHRGQVRVQSVLGQGSEFIISLPALGGAGD